MKQLKLIIAALFLISPFAASADPLSYGALSSDTRDSEIIMDSLNGLEWLKTRDTTGPLVFREVLDVIAPGGTYEGWQLAGIAEINLFLNAFLLGQESSCSLSYPVTDCTLPPADPFYLLEDLLGAGLSGFDSAIFFLSDNGVGQEVGLLNFIYPPAFLQVKVNYEYTSIADAEVHGCSNKPECPFNQLDVFPIGLLLYREATPVPEPSTLALLGLGLAGMSMTRRRKKV